MKKAKITSDGKLMTGDKTIQLTEEQLDMLGIKIRKNPFERVADGDPYYYIAPDNYIRRVYENYDQCNYDAYYNVNYFNDKDFANQVALHQLLYRKLLKFAYDNECEDNQEWNKTNCHYYICYNTDEGRFYADTTRIFKHNDVWFCSRDSANRAIKEVVKPFVKKHPNFVW